MKIRQEYLQKEYTLANSGSPNFNARFGRPITAIDFLFEITNGATSNTAKRLSDEVTAISVEDGSYTVFALPLREAMALGHFTNPNAVHRSIPETGAGVQHEHCRILFGRYYGDPEYYLDAPSYNNLQVRLTNAFTVSATAGFTTGTGKVSIIVHTIEEGAASHKGVMRTQSIYDKTSAASGDENADVSIDHMIASIMLIARITTKEPYEVVSNVKLLCDNGSFVPFDKMVHHQQMVNYQDYPAERFFQTAYATDADTMLAPLYSQVGVECVKHTDLDLIGIESIDADVVTLQVLSVTVAPAIAKSVADTDIGFMVTGHCPEGAVYFTFGDLRRGDFFDARKYKDIRFRMSQEAASAQLRCIVTQVAKR